MIIQLNNADKPEQRGLGYELKAQSIVRKSQDVFLFDTGIRAKPIAGYYLEIIPSMDLLESHFVGAAPIIRIIDPSDFTLVKFPLRYVGHQYFIVDVVDGYETSLMEARAKALLGTNIAHMMNKAYTNIPLTVSSAS